MPKNNGLRLNATGMRIFLGIVSIIVLIAGVAATYGALNNIIRTNSKELDEIKPQVKLNDNRLIRLESDILYMRNSQDRIIDKQDKMDEKIDILLQRNE